LPRFPPIRITERPTSVKTRFRAAGQQILRVDEEISTSINDAAQDQVFRTAARLIEGADLAIISDYAKGTLPRTLIRRVIDLARDMRKPVIVDPKIADFSAYAGATLLTPNLSELRAITKLPTDSIDSIGRAASALAAESDIDNVLTTLSANGMLLSTADGQHFHDPASARDVFDVSGAGDTVIAALGGAMAVGAGLQDAIRLANHAAGVAVGKSGTATVVPGEILAHMGMAASVTDWQNAGALCLKWRESGQKIAFANGCFDLLHPGHLMLLQQAASHADRLVVGVNGDASIKRLKGRGRPVQPADIRSAVLASLGVVDAVVVFDEDTPFELISLLQPDFIVKGGDYRAEDVVGADIVAARGGKVVIVPILDGHSTSRLVGAGR
jgi:D-beta-D-heptose 7-phosphate kinase/D-beta-D-heptose 1-phosphate adenosyltransferase